MKGADLSLSTGKLGRKTLRMKGRAVVISQGQSGRYADTATLLVVYLGIYALGPGLSVRLRTVSRWNGDAGFKLFTYRKLVQVALYVREQ